MNTNNNAVPEEIESCPIYQTLQLFQGKWNIWVLFELSKKSHVRFGELKKSIPGISNTMLTSTLKDLEGQGLVNREQFNEIPPHVEYSATKKAADLKPIYEAMSEWGEKYAED